MDWVHAAISAWTDDMRRKTVGKEPSKEEETKCPPLVWAAQDRGPANWTEFGASSPAAQANIEKAIVGARRVSTWEIMQGELAVRARSAAKGFKGPDLQQGLAETAGCVSLRSSHLQLLSLRAMKNGESGTCKRKMPST